MKWLIPIKSLCSTVFELLEAHTHVRAITDERNGRAYTRVEFSGSSSMKEFPRSFPGQCPDALPVIPAAVAEALRDGVSDLGIAIKPFDVTRSIRPGSSFRDGGLYGLCNNQSRSEEALLAILILNADCSYALPGL